MSTLGRRPTTTTCALVYWKGIPSPLNHINIFSERTRTREEGKREDKKCCRCLLTVGKSEGGEQQTLLIVSVWFLFVHQIAFSTHRYLKKRLNIARMHCSMPLYKIKDQPTVVYQREKTQQKSQHTHTHAHAHSKNTRR